MAKLPVDVLWIARYDYGAGWTLRTHQHDYMQMILFLDGKGVYTAGDSTVKIRGGEFCLIRPGEAHGLRAETLMRTLDVKFRVTPGAFERRLRRSPPMVRGMAAGIAGRLVRIRAEGERTPPFYREVCSVLLTEILYLYLRQETGLGFPDFGEAGDTEPPAHDALLERALACIRTRHREALTVREIARDSGCTERTLRMHFHAVLQTAPLAYLQRHRIGRARELIQYSDYTLKEIAEQVGFRTVHHFTRHFAAAEGKSPAVWRRDYQEGIRKDVYINPKFQNQILTVPGA